ncbi:aminomethyl transferase family protein [Bradyrhizobium sp. ma5]|uniref:aminomethyl transferase family protein n=1 Tax=Bradyrhizobium sp. ma5 TaxID=3344828 RepID=UPI0035D3F7B3
MSVASPFALPTAVPFYPEYPLFNLGGGAPRQWEFNGWKQESMSWKTSSYIHGGLSGPAQFLYEGPDAEKFLSQICVNSFANFAVGTAKHAIMCTDSGHIAGHGVLQRPAQDQFRLFVAGPWSRYQYSKTNLDVKETVEDNFLFQVAGPNSLRILEKVTKEDLRDIKYLRYRQTKIAGRSVQIMRMGMAGTIAYELHGPVEDGATIYEEVYQAGLEFGIERLGWLTYTVNHIEAGFPQQSWTFIVAAFADPGFNEYVKKTKPLRFMPPAFSGSIDPNDIKSRFRNPFELGWDRSVRFDHDFIGRAALEREHADPKRTIVTLVWNTDDVVDIYSSLFRPGQEYKYLELPAMPNYRYVLAHADHVSKNGHMIGVSSGIAYSYYYRQVISHCVIDRAEAQIGNEVELHWGDFGGRIRQVRAVVARYPYLNEADNKQLDPSAFA